MALAFPVRITDAKTLLATGFHHIAGGSQPFPAFSLVITMGPYLIGSVESASAGGKVISYER
jgi:hypothetical protein